MLLSSVVCNNGDIRLVDGSAALEGRVEVCNSQAWGTVCDDQWGNVDARVACAQLGYQREGKLFNHHVKMKDIMTLSTL